MTNYSKSNPAPKETLILITLIYFAMLVFIASYLTMFWVLVFTLSYIFTVAAGMIGKDRKIGFWPAFLIASFIPVLGFIFALISPKKEDEAYRERMMEIAEQNNASSVADQLYRLNELRKEGVLSDEEFAMQKDRLLNS